jgi:hypothetical protein
VQGGDILSSSIDFATIEFGFAVHGLFRDFVIKDLLLFQFILIGVDSERAPTCPTRPRIKVS